MKYLPLIGAGMSGSQGGVTASRNRYGTYFRQRAIPVNPNTAQQQSVRSYFASVSAAWNAALSNAQRTAWTDYADATPVTDAIGQEIVLTGYSMYLKCNVPRLQVGLSRIDDGPTTPGLAELSPVGIGQLAADTSLAQITFDNTDPWAATDGGALTVLGSRFQSSGTNYFKGPYQLAGSIDGSTSTPPTSPQTVTWPFAVAAGRKYFAQFRALAPDGRISGAQRLGITAIAS